MKYAPFSKMPYFYLNLNKPLCYLFADFNHLDVNYDYVQTRSHTLDLILRSI